VTLHLSLLPADVPRLAQRLADSGARWLAYPTTGIALASLATDVDDTSHVIQALRRSATERGGSLIVTRAPVEVKGRIDVWGDGGSALPLMRRLKHQFDPKGTLNPGRFVGGL
jgi:glycolate oxidase FAD binding subunit